MKLLNKLKIGKKKESEEKVEKVKAPKKSEVKTDSKKKEASKVEKKQTKVASKKVAKKNKKAGLAHKILKHPVISEKSAYLASANKFVFAVDVGANKIQIKEAIAEVYGVMPLRVNVIKNKGKQVNFRRIRGRTSDWKKAIVTLKKGDKIDVYEGV